jgi:hypothetical protein
VKTVALTLSRKCFLLRNLPRARGLGVRMRGLGLNKTNMSHGIGKNKY